MRFKLPRLGAASYILVVLALTIAIILLDLPRDDADIGLGLLVVVLYVLALPWSIVVYAGDFGITTDAITNCILAILNVCIIGLVVGRRSRVRETGSSGR